MTPATYHLPSVVEGDTWAGIPALTVRVNNAAPASALALVRIQIRRRHDDADALVSLHSGSGGGISIDDAAAWEVSVARRVLDLPAGRYVHDVEFTDAAGEVRTYLAGSLSVGKQVTR
jgi:hypothetical protein